MFGTVFLIIFCISLFFNGLSGSNMFPFQAVIGVSIVLTFLFTGVGWLVSTAGAEVLLKNNDDYQQWRKMGGRPYWDSIGWPVNAATPIERQTGLAEPEYTDFVPPPSWQYQCPVCGSRVEKQIDVCWNCNYGADGDGSAYVKRWGTAPPEGPPVCTGPACQVPVEQKKPKDWRPVS